MCSCLCICVYACVSLFGCVCGHVCLFGHLYVCMCLFLVFVLVVCYVSLYNHTSAQALIHLHTCIYTFACIHTETKTERRQKKSNNRNMQARVIAREDINSCKTKDKEGELKKEPLEKEGWKQRRRRMRRHSCRGINYASLN